MPFAGAWFMHYRIYIAETPLPRRGPSPRWGFVEGVDRANVSIIQSVAHLDTWTGGGEGVNRALTVANDTWRHVPQRCTFRGPRVPTILRSAIPLWRGKSRETGWKRDFSKRFYRDLVSCSWVREIGELFLCEFCICYIKYKEKK